jgi:hypothetical protein
LSAKPSQRRRLGTKSGRASPEDAKLSQDEQKSVTHGEFWIPEHERVVYRNALETLNKAGIPYVVSGLYAIYQYTGIYRKTKDLDLFFEPAHVLDAARALKEAGFSVHLEQAHWLAKAYQNGVLVDLIYGMGNGIAFIDDVWYKHSRPGILAATQVRVSPPEELIWHRLFVSERHRSDMADTLHLLNCRGDELDWERLLARVGEHWRLLLAQLLLFDYAYPGHRRRVPTWMRETLFERAHVEIGAVGDPTECRGTLISRFSFAIDVNEWSYHDVRMNYVEAARHNPIVQEIMKSDIWQKEKPNHAA